MANKPYASMQALIRDQAASAQLMRDAAISIKNAADMFAIVMGNNAPTVSRPGSGQGPNNSRPRMGENQTYRPVHNIGEDHGIHGHGISAIRRQVAQHLHVNYGHGSGSTFDKIYDDNGNHVGYRETRSDGSFAVRDLNDPNLQGDLASAGRRATISRLAGGVGEGGIMGLARSVPYVGGAIAGAEAVHEGFVRFGKERQANAQYQSIYGGTNLQGMGQRFQQEGFKLSQLFSGGLTGSQATQAFQGVSALGFQGAQRSQDLNFISSNYKSLGIGVAESLQLITTASKNLNTSLTGLKDGLNQVTESAKATGQSAVSARAIFASNYGAISTANPGATAGPIASSLTSMQVGMGRSMQGLDLSGAFTSLNGQAQLAAVNGQTLGQLQASELTDPSKALGAFDTVVAQATSAYMTPEVQAVINQAVQQAGGKSVFEANPDSVGQVITPQVLPLVSPQSIMASLQARIPNLKFSSSDQAVTFMIMQYLGLAGNTLNNYQALQKSKQQNLSNVTSAAGLGGSAGRSNAGNLSLGGSTKYGTAAKGVNPVVDDALSNFKGKNVIVDTAGGKRVVSIDVAASTYTDQVAKGTATLADTGQSISAALGGESETNYQGIDTTSYKAKRGQTTNTSGLSSARGMDVKAYHAMMAKKDSQKTSGTVVISPSKELQQLLNFQTSGNVQISNDAAAAGSTAQPGG